MILRSVDQEIDGLVEIKLGWFKADGHMVETARNNDILQVSVSRDSVRIAFLIAALNGLEVKSADIAMHI